MSSIPFIGSKISLISKSDVRYEGTLCHIDTQESKVYLQHVHCFGTEDRKKENIIAPSPETYEYIIFHSSDIKDLSVCEVPPVYDSMGFGGQYNPMGGYPQYGYPMMHPQYGYPPYPYNNYGMYSQMVPQEMGGFHNPQSVSQPSGSESNEKPETKPQQTNQQVKINVTSSKNTDAPAIERSEDKSKSTESSQESHSQSSEPVPAEGQKTSADGGSLNNRNNNRNKRMNNNSNNKNYVPKSNQSSKQVVPQSQPEKTNENINTEQTPSDNTQKQFPKPSENKIEGKNEGNNAQDNRNKNRNYSNNNNNYHRGYGNKGNYNKRGYDSRFHNPEGGHKVNDKKTPEDFDFLSSNEKFEKMSEGLEKEIPKFTAYNKEESFYDNISCETSDRDDTRDKKTFFDQKRLDAETFGESMRHRGGGGRGHTRGRYDANKRYYNSNNPNYSNRSSNYHRNNNYRGKPGSSQSNSHDNMNNNNQGN